MLATQDIDCKHGRFRTIDGDIWVSRSLRELGEYSEGELAMMRLCLGLQGGRKNLRLVEAGAYIGDLTVPLSRLVTHLYAFEPQREVREILEWNLAANGCDNVTVFPYALGHEAATGCYTTVPDSPGSTQMLTAEGTEPMEVRTLDSFELDVDFFKADVEGMEILALAGAQDTLLRCRPTLFLERDTVPTDGQISQEDLFPQLGYDYYPLAFPLYRPDNYRGLVENTFGHTASFMSLGVPWRQ